MEAFRVSVFILLVSSACTLETHVHDELTSNELHDLALGIAEEVIFFLNCIFVFEVEMEMVITYVKLNF